MRGPRRQNAAAGAERIGKVRLVAQRMSAGMTAATCAPWSATSAGKLGDDPAVVALIAEGRRTASRLCPRVRPNRRPGPGIRANDLVKQLAAAVDGRGGGKADLAQGSGKNASGIDAALDAVRAEIARVG